MTLRKTSLWSSLYRGDDGLFDVASGDAFATNEFFLTGLALRFKILVSVPVAANVDKILRIGVLKSDRSSAVPILVAKVIPSLEA